jgi:hypothetical protein
VTGRSARWTVAALAALTLPLLAAACGGGGGGGSQPVGIVVKPQSQKALVSAAITTYFTAQGHPPAQYQIAYVESTDDPSWAYFGVAGVGNSPVPSADTGFAHLVNGRWTVTAVGSNHHAGCPLTGTTTPAQANDVPAPPAVRTEWGVSCPS